MTTEPKAASKPAPTSFVWSDPFLLEDQLHEEERMIRDAAAAFAADKLAPRNQQRPNLDLPLAPGGVL